jgi:hypothetical protein
VNQIFNAVYVQVKAVLEDCMFWHYLSSGTSFLTPFGDLIHQIEADRPALTRCYDGLIALDRHIRICLVEWESDIDLSDGVDRALGTW